MSIALENLRKLSEQARASNMERVLQQARVWCRSFAERCDIAARKGRPGHKDCFTYDPAPGVDHVQIAGLLKVQLADLEPKITSDPNCACLVNVESNWKGPEC